MDNNDYSLEDIISEAINKKNDPDGTTDDAETEKTENTENVNNDTADKKPEKPHKGSKGKNKKSRKFKIILAAVITVLSIILLLCGAFVALAFHYIGKIDVVPHQEEYSVLDSIPDDDDLTSEPDSPKEVIDDADDKIKENIEKNATEIVYDENVYNVLLIGTDTRNNSERGRSDTMILVSINKESKEIYMTSFMRDSYVAIPGKYNNRINASYAFGGPELLMDTIEQNFKIKIDKYVRVNFFSFMEVIDAVGGVEITVSDDEVRVLNNYVTELNGLLGKDPDDGKLASGGTYNLNGKQALGYCRIRYVGNADFQRTQRQRDVMKKIFEKAKKLSLSEMDDFLNILLPKITTNIQEGEIFGLLLNAPMYLGYDLKEMRVPADGTYSFMTVNRMSVLGIDFDKNIEMLRKNIYKK